MAVPRESLQVGDCEAEDAKATKAPVPCVSFTAHDFQYPSPGCDLSYKYLLAIFKKVPTRTNSGSAKHIAASLRGP